MIIFSLIEIIFFCIDEATAANSTKYGIGPIATLFVYEPNRRREAWRYITYMFVHIGWVTDHTSAFTKLNTHYTTEFIKFDTDEVYHFYGRVFHLLVNLLVQILLGIPLEMVHKWWRVLIVYFAGVLAGSLGTSILDPTVKLAGASGGVYSLVTAHVASIIMVITLQKSLYLFIFSQIILTYLLTLVK